jgi:DNA polymerase I-like protein with 3'-5' exonuclease and polymerase domains
MIEAYRNGIDLHAVTASGIAGWGLGEFLALKKIDKEKYDEIRQLGKAGNFGTYTEWE